MRTALLWQFHRAVGLEWSAIWPLAGREWPTGPVYGIGVTYVTESYARNRDDELDAIGNDTAFEFTWDLTASSQSVYAVWSPVPEPGTALLMSLSLLGLSARKRREG